MGAVQIAKQKFPTAMITRAVETSAPLEDSMAKFFKSLKNLPRFLYKIKFQLYDKLQL